MALEAKVTVMQGKSHDQGMGCPSELEKPETDVPGSLQQGPALPVPDSSLMKRTLKVWLPELEEKRFLLVQAPEFVTICYSGNKKLIPKIIKYNIEHYVLS